MTTRVLTTNINHTNKPIHKNNLIKKNKHIHYKLCEKKFHKTIETNNDLNDAINDHDIIQY
jgi:hypothetical protein